MDGTYVRIKEQQCVTYRWQFAVHCSRTIRAYTQACTTPSYWRNLV